MSRSSDYRENLHGNQYNHPDSESNFLPELMVDQANLQEFGQQVSVIRELEMTGKISRFESCQQIKRLWNHLKQNKEDLARGGDKVWGNTL